MNRLMTAAVPATATSVVPLPTGETGPLPAGLTTADGARIAEALAAVRTEDTRRVYALVWGQWQPNSSHSPLLTSNTSPPGFCSTTHHRAVRRSSPWVSYIRTETSRPEAAVMAATIQMAGRIPQASASTPVSSAPTAKPRSRQRR
jgi:hypothetical protein